jgi:hypothetical protein
MSFHGHATTWGTPIGIGRSRHAKRWYAHLHAWWDAYKMARHEARLAALKARWDAQHEAVTPYRAEAAADMMAREHTFSTATVFSDLAC